MNNEVKKIRSKIAKRRKKDTEFNNSLIAYEQYTGIRISSRLSVEQLLTIMRWCEDRRNNNIKMNINRIKGII